MVGSMLGGVGLFLLGMILMTDGLKTAAGNALRKALARFTGGRFSALVSGATLTALVQSSSATTLATIGFVSAGILTFEQAVGVVFGANLGTTSTGWLVSLLGFKVSVAAFALPMVGAGALANLLGRGRWRAAGLAVAGFGLIFVGIDQLQTGMASLATRLDPSMLPGDTFLGRLALVGLGVLMTVVMQSSSAAVATTLAALHAGTIGLDHAAALVIGQNVGTTVTAGLAAIGASTAARRTALAHALFNLLTGIVALATLPLFVRLARELVDNLDGPGGAPDAALALAAFHTLFNLLGVMLLLPVIRQFSRLVVRLVPERRGAMTRFLDHSVGEIGPIGVEAAHRTAREIAVRAVAVLAARANGKPDATEHLTLDAASGAISEARRFLGRVRSSDVEPDRARHLGVLHALDHLEELAEAAHAGPSPALLAEVPAAREPVAEALRLTGVWLAEPGGGAPRAETAAHAGQAAAELTSGRRLILEKTAAGELDAEQADARIGALRWLDRVARHLARAVHYLE